LQDIDVKEITLESVFSPSSINELSFGSRKREIPSQARAKLEQQIRDSREFIFETYEILPEDHDTVKEISRIGEKFEFLQDGKKITYHVINSNVINAFALGDEIYISTALLNVLPDEDCVAFVLAHEAKHISEGHLFIRYDEQTPETINKGLKRASLPRIHEYEADTGSSSALNQAGYDPTASQTTLAILSDFEQGIDLTHGSLTDRQSIQRTVMRVVDFEHSGSERTIKNSSLQSLPEYPHLFFFLDRMLQTDKDRFEEKLEQMSPKTLLRYHAHLTEVFDQMYSDEVMEKKSLNSDTIIRFSNLILATDREVNRRISVAHPEILYQEREWLKIQLLTEVADRSFASLQLPSKLMMRQGYIEQSHNLDYAAALNKTIETPDDLIAFTKFIQEQKYVVDLGYELVEREFPERIFWKYANEMGWNQGDVFFHDLLIKFARCNYIFQTQENSRIDFSAAAELVDQVGLILGSEDNERAKLWFRTWLHKSKDLVESSYIDSIKKRDPHLYDTNTPEALERYAPEVLPHLVDLYIEFAQMEARRSSNPHEVLDRWKDRAPAYITARVFGDLEYNEEQKMEGVVKVAFLGAFYPESDLLLTSINHKDEEALTRFLEKYGTQHFFELFSQFGFSSIYYQDTPWAKEVLDKYLESNSELTPENRAYFGSLIAASSRFLPSEFRNNIKEATKNSVNLEFLIDELGLTKEDFRLLLRLEAISALEVGGNENITYKNFMGLVNSLNPNDYSEKMQRLLFDKITSLAAHGGSVFTNYQERNWDLNWGLVLESRILKSARDIYANNEFSGLQSNKERLQAVQSLSVKLERVGKMYYREPVSNLMGINEYQAAFLSPLIIPITESISNATYSVESIEDLREVHELIGFFDDRRLTARLRQQLELKMLKLMDFDQATDFIQKLNKKGDVNFEVVDHYQEYFVRTPKQLEQAHQVLDEILERTTKEGNENIAIATWFDTYFEYFLSDHSLEFLEAAVETRRDDTKLRKLLAEHWYEQFAGSSTRPYRVDLPEIGSQKSIELTGGARHMFVPFEDFVNMFYSQVSQREIDLMLRKVLISREGVLMTADGKKALHDMLMKEVLAEDENSELIELLSEVTRVGLNVIDPAQLYEPISALLRKNILVKPQAPGDNTEAASILVEKRNNDIKSQINIYQESRKRSKTLWKLQENSKNYLEVKARYEKYITNIQQMLDLLAFSPEISPDKRVDEVNKAVQSIGMAKDHLNSIVEFDERDPFKDKIAPVIVVKEMAQSMGSVGVRFLQLIGQYVEMPSEYEEEFSTVYDSMRGQLKYTAYKTLKREAQRETATPELRNFWSDLDELSETVGGGSLYTVYAARMRDGSQKVVKVLAPNAISFIQDNIASSRDVASGLLTTPEYKENNGVKLAEVLLDDLEDWLIADIRAIDYEHDDREFSRLHDGVASEQGITIKVPYMTPTGTMYIKIEDNIAGQNLTTVLKKSGEADQTRHIVESVREDFYRQIETPSATRERLVHSDVHKGNVRIAKENDGSFTVWWLDRGYYLKFNEAEAELISPLIRGQFSMTNATKLLGYLNSLPQNSNLNITRSPLFLVEMAKIVSDLRKQGKSPLQTASAVMLELRRKGIYIPLNWSLLLKNVVNLNNMSLAVGENNI